MVGFGHLPLYLIEKPTGRFWSVSARGRGRWKLPGRPGVGGGLPLSATAKECARLKVGVSSYQPRAGLGTGQTSHLQT